MLHGGIKLYTIVRLYFNYSKKYNCFAGFPLTLPLFRTPAHINKHNVTFIKLGTNVVNIITLWRYCFPRYKVFG